MGRTDTEAFSPNGAMQLPRKDLRAMVAEVWSKIEAILDANKDRMPAESTVIATFRQPFVKPDGTPIDAEVSWHTDIPTLRSIARGRTRIVLQAMASPATGKVAMLMDSLRLSLLTLQMDRGQMRRAFGEDAYDILSHEFTHLLEPAIRNTDYGVEPFILEAATAIWDDYMRHFRPGTGVPHGHMYSKLTKRFLSKRGGEMQVRVDVEVHQPEPGGPQWPMRDAVLSVQAVENQRGEPVLFIILDGRTGSRPGWFGLKDQFLNQLIPQMQDVIYRNWAPDARQGKPRWWKLYHNDEWEVRAFLQELWLELRTVMFQRLLNKLVRAGKTNQQIVDEIIKESFPLQENWKNLTPENKKPFLKEMSYMIERARTRVDTSEARVAFQKLLKKAGEPL